MVDDVKKEINVIERISDKHITETDGFLLNNNTLDTVKEGDIIQKGTALQKSQAYDDYNNRMDGINLLTAYISCERSMEDGIILSDVAAKQLVSIDQESYNHHK